MSARFLRRTFATPFVVTLAAIPACVVQTAPPRGGAPIEPGPRTSEPARPTPTQSEPTVVANPPRPGSEQSAPPPTQPPVVVANPPRPGTEQSAPPPAKPPVVVANPPRPGTEQVSTYERHWTVSRYGDKCMASIDASCPRGATCNPPPPTAYQCTPEITESKPMKIVQWANTAGCHVETPAPPCPPKTMCEPPRPRAVPCPQ